MFKKKKKAQSKPHQPTLDSQLSQADSDDEDLPDRLTISRKHKVKQSLFDEHSQQSTAMFGREASGQSHIDEIRRTIG